MRLFKSNSKKHEAVQFDIAGAGTQAADSGIAIAVMVRDEAASIAEWLAFHRAAGVDHFILYDDACRDDTLAIARRTVGPDRLTIIPWAQRVQDAAMRRAIHSQGLAFAHAIGNFRRRFRWMAFIDVDEFIYPTRANSLQEVLNTLTHAHNILLPWQMFGRQGHVDTPARILPNYTQRHRDPYGAAVKGVLNVKCVVNPAHVTRAYVHGFGVDGGTAIWNSVGQQCDFGAHRQANFDPDPALALNHYYIKSDTELAQKTDKGSIGDSRFTAGFKTRDSRAAMLRRRLEEIERDTVTDRRIIDFCDRIGFAGPP